MDLMIKKKWVKDGTGMKFLEGIKIKLETREDTEEPQLGWGIQVSWIAEETRGFGA